MVQDGLRLVLAQMSGICHVVRSRYGPGRSWKIVTLSGETRLCCDTLDLLRVVCQDTRAGKLLLERCKDFREYYGCGLTSFVHFIGLLCTQALSLVEQDIPGYIISRGYQTALKRATSLLAQQKVKFTPSMMPQLGHGPEEIRHHSAQVAIKIIQNLSKQSEQQQKNYGSVMFHRLNKGNSRVQVEVHDGVLIPVLDAVNQKFAKRFSTEHPQIKLLRNSFTFEAMENSNHELNPMAVTSCVFDTSVKRFHETLTLLKSFERNSFILCSGRVDTMIQTEAFNRLGILILQWVALRDMEAMARMFGLIMYDQVEQLVGGEEPNAVEEISFVEMGYSSTTRFTMEPTCFLRIRGGQVESPLPPPVTVILSAPIPALMEEMESAIWSCLFRIRNAQREGHVCLGSGKTESFIAKQLFQENHQENHQASFLGETQAFEAFATALMQLELETTTNDAVLDDTLTKRRLLTDSCKFLHKLLSN